MNKIAFAVVFIAVMVAISAIGIYLMVTLIPALGL